MSLFIFSSGIPLAYLAFYGTLIAAIVVGSLIGIKQWKARPRGGISKPACLVAAALAVLAVNVYARESMERNPIVADVDLLGEWTHGGAVLTLARNGTFMCRGRAACPALGASGRWARCGDFELSFQSTDGRTIVRRLIQWGGDYHLAEIHYDPDIRIGKLTFQIRARAR